MEKQTKRRFVATGDLVADCYYQVDDGKKELVKVDGGASRFNVIANLAARGYNTKVISACGSDMVGEIVLNLMKDIGVDVKDVIRHERDTRKYHILPTPYGTHICEKTCPICYNKTWYEESFADFSYCIGKMRKRDVLILDGISLESAELILHTTNNKVLDLGRIKRLISLTEKQIEYFLKSRFEILQLNELVEKHLLARFELNSLIELYEILKPNLLIVTRGKSGTDFVYQHQIYSKVLKEPSIEFDDTGAGDAFLSVVIQEYYNNNKKVDQQFIDETFEKAIKVTSKVVSNLGARGHLYEGYYPEDTCDCMCEK